MREKILRSICLILIAFIIGVFAAFFYVQKYISNDSININQSVITEKINTISELCVTEISLRELTKFEKGEIPIINKNGFSMLYNAKVKIGFDLKKAEINSDGVNIKIKLPEPHIISTEIDEKSIEFYDEKNSIFNRDLKQDITIALDNAKQSAAQKAMNEENINRAKKDAQQIINTILKPIDDSKSYSIEFLE